MEFLTIVFGLLLVGGVVYLVREKKKVKKEKRKAEEERRKAEEERRKAEEEKKKDPCRDMRDGTYNPNWDKATCNKHGYFFCPIAKRCMPSSINVNECGKPAHLM